MSFLSKLGKKLKGGLTGFLTGGVGGLIGGLISPAKPAKRVVSKVQQQITPVPQSQLAAGDPFISQAISMQAPFGVGGFNGAADLFGLGGAGATAVGAGAGVGGSLAQSIASQGVSGLVSGTFGPGIRFSGGPGITLDRSVLGLGALGGGGVAASFAKVASQVVEWILQKIINPFLASMKSAGAAAFGAIGQAVDQVLSFLKASVATAGIAAAVAAVGIGIWFAWPKIKAWGLALWAKIFGKKKRRRRGITASQISNARRVNKTIMKLFKSIPKRAATGGKRDLGRGHTHVQ